MLKNIIDLFILGASRPVILYIVIASMLDITLGLIKAGIGKRFNSTISSTGVLKHVAMIVVPILASPLFDMIKGGTTYWNAFTALILLTMILSAVENWVSIGLPFPSVLKKYIDDSKTELVKPQDENEDGGGNEKE